MSREKLSEAEVRSHFVNPITTYHIKIKNKIHKHICFSAISGRQGYIYQFETQYTV